MYLEKLTIQGFKSFAAKNELAFVGMLDKTKRGITAVVGPNGSGKSNVADAIRWALGEQSMKSLRGKKSEDVIFSGSDKKGKLGMAEVSLHLNNEDKQAPIDYSQLILTRRLYRNGDSEYLINNSRVRLSDVQMLLAKAKFGQKTYSVIGQGTVEGFLNSSLAERKEFFDEATGVKQFQIKRDDALNKLKNSYDNLNQAEMLLVEIEPRLKSLTRQVNKLQKREELEKELKSFRLFYYRSVWHRLNDDFKSLNKNYSTVDAQKKKKVVEMEGFNKDLASLEKQAGLGEEFDGLQRELNKLQVKKDEINKKNARLEAQKELELESRGQFDLSYLNNRRTEIKNELELNKSEQEALQSEINKKEQLLSTEKEKENNFSVKISELNDKLFEASRPQKNQTDLSVETKVKNALQKIEEAEKSEDLQEVKNILAEIKKELLGTEKKDQAENEQIDEMLGLRKEIEQLGLEKEKIIKESEEARMDLYAKKERYSLKLSGGEGLKKELNSIEEKFRQSKDKLGSDEIARQLKKNNEEVEKIEKDIFELKKNIDRISSTEEEKRNKLFSLQKKVQALQNEINNFSNQLNELKINSTRKETKLEDLEAEIRRNLGPVSQIREKRNDSSVEEGELREKIEKTRKHLEHIGGIDPEVETEYINTKERYDFIDGQVKDLVGTIHSLEKVIKELDATIKEIFDKEFKLIQAKFEEYFRILFNGGRAKIIKVMDREEESNPEETNEKEEKSFQSAIDVSKIKFLQKHNATGLAGIEIQATPPGKKISSISMLSGGERALTAIALISAIISANPSPFVVLDEVDAALDEANSERLARILDDLSHKTQFIVITHNRATMKRANVLYGVTMGDDGISKLLSVKLEEASFVDKQ